jgi:DNA-binding transcriptional LysR family regulator
VNLESIDLNLLVVFEALMGERNVTRAARSIGLSQPAMSNALHRLRVTFDDPLFVRTSSGMLPTAFARSMFDSIRPALGQLRETIEKRPASILQSQTIPSTSLPAIMRKHCLSIAWLRCSSSLSITFH